MSRDRCGVGTGACDRRVSSGGVMPCRTQRGRSGQPRPRSGVEQGRPPDAARSWAARNSRARLPEGSVSRSDQASSEARPDSLHTRPAVAGRRRRTGPRRGGRDRESVHHASLAPMSRSGLSCPNALWTVRQGVHPMWKTPAREGSARQRVRVGGRPPLTRRKPAPGRCLGASQSAVVSLDSIAGPDQRRDMREGCAHTFPRSCVRRMPERGRTTRHPRGRARSIGAAICAAR